ncbi:ABC multidrug transporter E like protein [Verticillium longisporum]|nr:ABC multidrug transporter E like protein [Verticillium longisporum]
MCRPVHHLSSRYATALDRACRGRTTIVIAHRLGTIKKAHNIVLLRHGKVVQQGTHESLMEEVGGAYHALATAQQLDMGSDMLEDFNEKAVSQDRRSRRRSRDSWRSLDLDDDDSGDDLLDAEESLLRVIKGPDQRTGRFSRMLRPFGSFGTLLSEQTSRWAVYIVILIGALGAGASTPIQAYLFANLVSLFSFWGSFLMEMADYWCLWFFYLAVGVGFSYLALCWSTTSIGFGITRAYRKEYFANMLSKSASFFDAETNSAGALTARLATDPTQLQQLLGTNMAFALVSVFNAMGCVVVGLVFGWKLTIVALCTSTPLIVAAMYYRVRHEMGFEAMNNAVFAESAKFASESIAAMRTVSSLTMEAGICGRYETLLRDHIGAAFRKSVFSVMLFSFSDSISLLCMAFVLWYGGHLLARHEYSPFQYMIVYIAVVQGGMSAGQWLSYGPNIANATAAADRILAMREHDDDDVDADSVGCRQLDDVPDEKGVHVEFKNVWFNYPTRPGPVLKGMSLQIKRGQFAAIVGPSGSGKTTIISLLERFYSVETGTIAINSQNILSLDLHTHRSNLSLVSQEPNIFSGSLRANILLGVPNESSVTDADLHGAARDAGLHDFIASLPEGYDTPVGAAGVALSGGQKQRVSIARALIRRPELLLLDEATSSLDSETEREVQAVFDAAKGQRTMITVAHRLATPSPSANLMHIGYHELAVLCSLDEQLLRAQLARPTSDSRTRVALIPDLDATLWHLMREDFMTTHIFGKTPTIRGAVFGAPGNRVWAVWTRGYYGGLKKPEGNTFHILRVSIEDEDAADEAYLAEAMSAIIGLAREEAAAWKVNNVELWNPTAKLRAAIDRAGLPHEFVDRQDTSIACLMWYGHGEVDWVANEKFGWC